MLLSLKGTIYSNSTEYYITSNLSERDLNYIKESWKLENKDKGKNLLHKLLIENRIKLINVDKENKIIF